MIPVVRRSSIGGTVFHDLGNINYSLITKRPTLEAIMKLQLRVS